MVAVAHEKGKPVEQLPPTGSIAVRVPGDVFSGRHQQPLKILLIAAEVAPFAKVGGLADVMGALPKALKAQGHDVRIMMLSYKMIENSPVYNIENVFAPFPVPIRPGISEQAYLRRSFICTDNKKSKPSNLR